MERKSNIHFNLFTAILGALKICTFHTLLNLVLLWNMKFKLTYLRKIIFYDSTQGYYHILSSVDHLLI